MTLKTVSFEMKAEREKREREKKRREERKALNTHHLLFTDLLVLEEALMLRELLWEHEIFRLVEGALARRGVEVIRRLVFCPPVHSLSCFCEGVLRRCAAGAEFEEEEEEGEVVVGVDWWQ